MPGQREGKREDVPRKGHGDTDAAIQGPQEKLQTEESCGEKNNKRKNSHRPAGKHGPKTVAGSAPASRAPHGAVLPLKRQLDGVLEILYAPGINIADIHLIGVA